MRAILLAGLLLLNGLAAGQLLSAKVASDNETDPQWFPCPHNWGCSADHEESS